MNTADTLAGLAAKQAAYEAMLRDKQAELDTQMRSMSEIVSELLAAKSPESRQKLVQRRGEIAIEVSALDDEIGELCRRRDASEVAGFQVRYDEARDQLDKLAAVSTKARQERDKYSLVRLQFMNQGGRALATEEAEFERVRIDAEYARLNAESAIAGRRTERAHGHCDQMRRELEQVRERLGV